MTEFMPYTTEDARAVVAWYNTDADTAQWIGATQKLIDMGISPTHADAILEDLRVTDQLVPLCEKHEAVDILVLAGYSREDADRLILTSRPSNGRDSMPGERCPRPQNTVVLPNSATPPAAPLCVPRTVRPHDHAGRIGDPHMYSSGGHRSMTEGDPNDELI